MKQAIIGTTYLDDPITLTVAYEMLPDGTSYPKRLDLSYPKKETQVILENSDYQLLPEAAAAAQAPADEGWPRRTVKDGAALITYQPQVDEWKDFKTLTWRMAVSLTPRGGKAAIGALSIEALTDVDNEKHTVLIHDLKVQRVNFPSLEKDAAAAAQMDQLVRTFLPPTVTISLERIVASTPKKESSPAVQLKNDPPADLCQLQTRCSSRGGWRTSQRAGSGNQSRIRAEYKPVAVPGQDRFALLFSGRRSVDDGN